MSGAITVTKDGVYILLALEYASNSYQVITQIHRDDLGAWSAVYNPGSGAASNAVAAPGAKTRVFVHGNIDTDVGILRYSTSTGATEDISPASLGADIINALVVSPSSSSRIVGAGDDGQLWKTIDGGDTWEDFESVVGAITALAAKWKYKTVRVAFAGLAGELWYLPDEGDPVDVTGSLGLADVTNICSLELT